MPASIARHEARRPAHAPASRRVRQGVARGARPATMAPCDRVRRAGDGAVVHAAVAGRRRAGGRRWRGARCSPCPPSSRASRGAAAIVRRVWNVQLEARRVEGLSCTSLPFVGKLVEFCEMRSSVKRDPICIMRSSRGPLASSRAARREHRRRRPSCFSRAAAAAAKAFSTSRTFGRLGRRTLTAISQTTRRSTCEPARRNNAETVALCHPGALVASSCS